MDCSSWAMIAAQKWHFSSFLKLCFACFCCRCQGFLKVVQAWHVRDPLHQTGKYVNQEIELYFIVKLCLLEIRTKRWVMLGHVLHKSHSSFSQESTRKCCGGWLGRMPGFPACCFQFQHEVYGSVIWRCIILMKTCPTQRSGRYLLLGEQLGSQTSVCEFAENLLVRNGTSALGWHIIIINYTWWYSKK